MEKHTLNRSNTQAPKVALVTAGARRIGAAIVQQLHDAGYALVIHCRHALADADNLAQSLNTKRPHSAIVLQQELNAPNAPQELILKAYQWQQRLDLLVNNASVFIRTDCQNSDMNNWDELFQSNVKAPFLLSIAARPYLAVHQGAILNITDIHGEKPLKGYSIYCQTKAALEMQTKSLACEFAPEVRVNAIAPGSIAWPEQDNALSQELQQKIIAKTLLKKHGDPRYIAEAVLFFAEQPFLTGQTLKVDGGRGVDE